MLQVAFSFQNLSKSHMLDNSLISSKYYNVQLNHDFILAKSLNSPNLHINWANMWYPDHENKKLIFVHAQ